jgi:hypothetical protein
MEGVGAKGGAHRKGQNGSKEVGDGGGRGEVGSIERRKSRKREIEANSPFIRPAGSLIVDFLLRGGGRGEAALAGAAAVAGVDSWKGGIIITERQRHGGRNPAVHSARPPVDEPTTRGHPLV